MGLEAISAVLSATNTTFESNAAMGGSLYTRGGALYVDKGTAEFGGAVVFRSNNASSNSVEGAVGGGAIFLTNSASLSALEGPVFEANRATGTEPKGGALFVDESSAVIASAKFGDNNVAVLLGEGWGGASPIRSVRSAERTCERCRSG